MKSVGNPHRSSRGKVISLAIIAIVVAVAIYVEHWISIHPSTDDATIDADVVHVASAVGGRIIELPVTENAKVSKGDLLFRIDPVPYRLAVEQAEADLGVAAGALDTRRRAIATEKSNATIAAAQIKRAQTNLELATRTAERLRPLAGKAYVPTQQFDQAQTAQRDAATSLQQAREQEVAALRAIGTEEAAVAAVQARQAALAIARRALDDTIVRAWHDGRVVGLTVLSGEMVVPSQALFTLISTEEWFDPKQANRAGESNVHKIKYSWLRRRSNGGSVIRQVYLNRSARLRTELAARCEHSRANCGR